MGGGISRRVIWSLRGSNCTARTLRATFAASTPGTSYFLPPPKMAPQESKHFNQKPGTTKSPIQLAPTSQSLKWPLARCGPLQSQTSTSSAWRKRTNPSDNTTLFPWMAPNSRPARALHAGRHVFPLEIWGPGQQSAFCSCCTPRGGGGCSNRPYTDSFPLPCHVQGGGGAGGQLEGGAPDPYIYGLKWPSHRADHLEVQMSGQKILQQGGGGW